MVDINLFDDEEEQIGKKGKADDSSAKKDEGSSADHLNEDDFNIDEDLSASSLDQFDSDVKPVFEDENPPDNHEKPSKRSGKSQQKISPVLIIILLVVVVAAVYFLYFASPSSKLKVKPAIPNNIPGAGANLKPDTSKFLPGSAVMKVDQGMAALSKGGTSSQTVKYVEAAKAVLNNLTPDGKFVALLLKGDQFFVEYGSETRGASVSIGQKIKTLLAADAFKASPEERHKVLEKDRYFGLISGNLPAAKAGVPTAQKLTADQFIQQLNALLNQQALGNRKIQKVSEYTYNGKLQTPVRLRIEGNRKNAMDFLESLKSLQGNADMLKLLVVPLAFTDLKANQVKMVIDFSVR